MSTRPVHERRLYTDTKSGRIVCFDHLGGYGKAYVKAEPQAAMWITPLDVWQTITAEEGDAWAEEFGKPMACETCKKGYPL